MTFRGIPLEVRKPEKCKQSDTFCRSEAARPNRFRLKFSPQTENSPRLAFPSQPLSHYTAFL